MVAVDTMEDFQKELDKGKVSGTTVAGPPCLPSPGYKLTVAISQ